MAQAARLSLRMQKELKLLITDPPHGASFPHLSADFNPSSLSSIDAQIEGPEGTVYVGGKFHIKIQIPERYPFQPPIVTFITPIYHPNIDNGGRICLDILNLPPKGAWQPSLNISAVLTSIGLLLGEPNPDDGLMCEASREYKYNRQAFDQKAKSMTEKYAKVGSTGSCSDESTSLENLTEVSQAGKETMVEVNKFGGNNKTLNGISQKLSLEKSRLKEIQACEGKEDTPSNHTSAPGLQNTVEAEEIQKDSRSVFDEFNLIPTKPCGTGRKLLLNSSSHLSKLNVSASYGKSEGPSMSSFTISVCNQQPHQERVSEVLSNSVTTGLKKLCRKTKNQPLQPSGSYSGNTGCEKAVPLDSRPLNSHPCSDVFCGSSPLPLPLGVNHKGIPHRDLIPEVGTGLNATKRRKLSLGLKGLSQTLDMDNKENVMPLHYSPRPSSQNPFTKVKNGQTVYSGPLNQLEGSNNGHSRLLTASQEPSVDSLKSKPMQQGSRFNDDQQSYQINNGTVGKKKHQRTEELPMTETIIVSDSEDSSEEMIESSRPKLSVARKRLQKWKAKA